MKMNTDKSIFEYLNELGLVITHKSGGFYDPNHHYFLKKESHSQMPCLESASTVTPKRKPIRFYDGKLFLKSIKKTQTTLNVVLFD